MKTRIFLIILGFIQSVYCSQISNITNDELYPVCPVKLFRRKRAHMEYTRWRSNVVTGSTEFIVKVLEDEVTTPNPKLIVAVNIQPDIKRGEKIIIGGAMVPPPSSSPSQDIRDYTRFVPPTTERHIDEDFYPSQAPYTNIDTLPPLEPKKGIIKEELPFPQMNYEPLKHEQRDESPPASPQFLSRAQTPSVSQQFAPIAPMFFNRRTKVTPPFNLGSHLGRTDTLPPMRSPPLPDVMVPTRTLSRDIIQMFDEEELYVTRTTTHTPPHRTSPLPDTTTEKVFDDEDVIPKQNNEGRRNEVETDFDKSYHNMFIYNDNSETRKKGDESFENDDEISKRPEENYVTEKEAEMGTKIPDTETETEVEEERFYNDGGGEEKTKKSNNVTPKFVTREEETSELPTKNKTVILEGTEKARQVCSVRKLRQLNFNSPRTLPEIVVQLKAWAEESPVAKWVDITGGNFTTMENPIYMMIVDDPSSGQIITAKQTVMVVAGIQGRDHYAVAAAMYVLYQLIERSDAHVDLMSKYRFWIIPVFNPDGYDYSMTFPQKREWTKNLHQSWESCRVRESCGECETYGLRCTVQPCYGVNLDRNFEYQWIPTEELRAEHPCGALYAGERQLSEVETRALTHYLHGLHSHRAPIYSFIAFKEGDVLGIMYPYSHTKKKRAFEHVYKQRASRAASAAYSISGRPYVAGQTSEFLPLYAGGIEDWVEGHLGIDYTYTIMLFQPPDSYNSKLITERVVHEAYAAMDTLLLQQTAPQTLHLTTDAQWRMSPSPYILFPCLLSICQKLISF